ncbi:MAG: AgmX/PglI C-terminal domain-containing protein [Candidatus Coatesbacteria bacterium]|nr:MAG: AgmX/PglI C-terminal domain-containing protein [Candidatus Coatesbacteria bacterium]
MRRIARIAALVATTAAAAGAAGEDEAVAIVKSWRDTGYYMDLGRAVEGLLTGFEAEGHSVQPIAWDASETLPGHFDVRYSFLLDAQDVEIIFLFDKEEGRVSPANELARAAVTIATTVNIGEGPAPPVKVKPGGERTAADIQAEVAIKQRELEGIYEDFLTRFPHAAGKLKVRFTIRASGDVDAVEVVETTINVKPLEVSLTRAINRWVFTPAARDVTLTYPFIFYRKQ